MKTSILRKQLAAVSLFAGKADVRYYLNGVNVEASPNETRLAATDGNSAAVARCATKNAERFEVTIPGDTVALALKMKSESLALERDSNDYWSLAGIRFAPVGGKFPDYRRIIPSSFSGVAAQFNPEFTSRAGKAGKALGHRSSPIIRHNGGNAALVQFYGDDTFIGVLMPLNAFTVKNPDQGIPTWGGELK